MFQKPLTPLENIKVVLSDVDGVMTDGGLYFSETGEQFKRFHVHDGMGLLLLKKAGFITGILTSDNLQLIKHRFDRVAPHHLYLGVGFDEKLNKALEICQLHHIDMSQVAYIGDDVNCIPLLMEVGFAACPANAVQQVKMLPNIQVLSKNGGQGAFREFADLILDAIPRSV